MKVDCSAALAVIPVIAFEVLKWLVNSAFSWLARGSAGGRSRWVYVVGIAAMTLILLVVVLHLTGTVGPGGR